MPNLRLCFTLSTLTALLGWLMLVGLPFWAWTDEWVLGLVVVLLALIYGYLLQAAMRQKPQPGDGRPGFFTLKGVLALFRNPTAALAGWVHILAFDLMVGLYIRSEGALLGLSHWALLPCYLLTLMFGPLGLLLFLVIRWLAL
ncbi:MAG: abscisic acid-deficient protein Aba4 family protein [Pseudomonadota bacterium]